MQIIGFFLSLVLGFNVGTFSFESNSSRYYVFKMYPIGSNPKTTPPVKGFACECVKSSGSTLSWRGWPDSQCSNTMPDKAISLGDASLGMNKMNNPPPIPAGACCKLKPRINGTLMPGVPQGNC
ncbi:MAG: hypothetical protein HOP36_12405 [Methyloglobulus sp.]|jgi:hypothetical protein|nr:hypothetical protein [Methyloglobulus sp.]